MSGQALNDYLANVDPGITDVLQAGVVGGGDFACSSISLSGSNLSLTVAAGLGWVPRASGVLVRVTSILQSFSPPIGSLPASGQYAVYGLEIDTTVGQASPNFSIVKGVDTATALTTASLIAANSPATSSGKLRIADFAILNSAGTAKFSNNTFSGTQGTNWIDRRPWARGAFYKIVPTSSPSTTSSSSTPLTPASDWSARLECSGAPMLIEFGGSGFTHTTSGGILSLSLLVDGVGATGVGCRLAGGGPDINNSLYEGAIGLVVPYTPSAGSHLFAWTFATNTGTVALPSCSWSIREDIRQNSNNGLT